MSSLDYLDLCRLCLVKDRVSVPIFEGEGDVRQIFLKIAACLPVKVGREDKLPKKICDDCVYKVELFYQFWNTTANAEKQLLQWLGEVSMDDKQGYVTGAHDPSMMKPGQNTGENRLDGSSVMQQVNEHTNNMGMGMMDGMGIGMPMMIPNSGQQPQQQQMTSVPMDTGGNAVQNVQPVPGPSAQIGQQKINAPTNEDEDEDESEEEDNSDDECDGDDGLPVKEESEDEPNRTIEPTTFVNVSLACDEAGPSGLQQQKIGEMPEMVMPPTDGDPKSGCVPEDFETRKLDSRELVDDDEYISQEGEAEFVEEFGTFEDHEIVMETLEYEEVEVRNTESLELELESLKSGISEVLDKSIKSRKSYDCDICGKSMRKKLQYIRHRGIHERSRVGSCDECDRIFYDEEKLRKHMIKIHQEDKPFPCMLCGKSFKTEEFLKTHSKQHNKKFTCDICGVSKVSGYDLRLHKKKHNQEYVIHCRICNKGFYTNQTLERHLLTHTGEKPFVCKICKTPYASSAYLSMHMKSHGQREKHKCNICNFESHWKAALKVHLKIHTGENQMTCEICGKSVSSKTYLAIHMRIHSGEKPHVCEICGKAFSVRKYLIVHLRTHTGEKPYECKICRKRFTQQGSLNAHTKCHSELK
ncbi:zinc finger protein 502-like isoform X17 [Venturia canescens]|uniref:zinc finger protein 502-like isoform X17 n=1 Tax=Venturia canescens TaxID=32260 RepID=UPI001C9BF522|nr:zinc finger protein 502-like isoform X17 [Venturia canescens]